MIWELIEIVIGGHHHRRRRRKLTDFEFQRNREFAIRFYTIIGEVIFPYVLNWFVSKRFERSWVRVLLWIWTATMFLFQLTVVLGLIFMPTSSAATKHKLIAVTVSKETDGDTIHVRMPDGQDKTIRMLLIDTPEDVKPGTPVEPFSLVAAHYAAKEMPVGKHIYIQEGKLGHRLDKYGRLLAYVFITKHDMYNEDVVKKGLARVAYIYPPNTNYLSTLKKDQAYAKAHHLGIWTIPGYVTPDGYNLDAVKSKHTSSKPLKTIDGIKIISETLNVAPRDKASLEIQTKSSTRGSIEVDYKSGPSHAKGLESQKADSHGDITWTWEVGSHTTPGNWPVIISVGGKSITLTLHVS